MKIEKGIPIPKPKKASSELLELLRQMEVGDSMFVTPNEGQKVSQLEKAIDSKVHRVKEKSFTKRRMEGGYRIWRTE